MRENKQETALKLSKKQPQSVINSHLQEEGGLNDLFKMLIYRDLCIFITRKFVLSACFDMR